MNEHEKINYVEFSTLNITETKKNSLHWYLAGRLKIMVQNTQHLVVRLLMGIFSI